MFLSPVFGLLATTSCVCLLFGASQAAHSRLLELFHRIQLSTSVKGNAVRVSQNNEVMSRASSAERSVAADFVGSSEQVMLCTLSQCFANFMHYSQALYGTLHKLY